MMKKFEIRTCGTCIHFMKSLCKYHASKADGFACTEYQTEISTPIMKEEQIHPFDTYDYINVYQINNDVFVAETIEDAIELYKKSRVSKYERNTICKVELLNYNAKIKRQPR